jgi:hypothetical protein
MRPTSLTVHSVFAEVLTRIQAQPQTLRIAAYKSALQRFDWNYEWSDDGRVYQRAKERFAELKHEAEQVDPGFEVWNQIAPARFANGVKACS